MLDDIVNKMTFDFTCTTERAAKSMRDEILNFKASRISSIISQVLAEKMDTTLLWKINKIEIDLGNIDLEDIGTDDILHKFKKLLAENIDQSRQTFHKEPGSKFLALSTTQAQIDIIKELLLHGDLPWWIDKKTFPGIDKTFKTAIYENKEDLKFFLDAQKNNRDVIQRIQSFCSPEIILLLDSIVPGITDFASVNPFASAGEKVPAKKLSHLDLQKIGASLLYGRISAGNQNLKLLMIRRFLIDSPGSLQPGIEIPGVITGNELAALGLFFNNRVGKIESENALQILQKLNFFQLEFLSHLTLFKTTQAESLPTSLTDYSNPESDKAQQQLESKKQVVLYITDKLKTKNPLLLAQLYDAPEQDLRDLQKLFSRYKNHNAFKKKMVSLIIEHPYFLKYKLLNLIANLSFELTGDVSSSLYPEDPGKQQNFLVFNQELKKSQSALQKVTRELTKSESLIFNDVFSSGVFSSASAKKTIEEVLNRLPGKSLNFISALTLLDKEEIEGLAPIHFARPDASAGFKKIIIENAGLCLLAPYLPAFFNQLGFTENGKFISKAYAHRALYLLQYIVNGQQRNYEYVLQLNKLLCGLKIDDPIPAYKRLSRLERNEAEDLLTSAINHWKALKSTSLKGFRFSFLQRKGILTETENSWALQVEKNAYDLLLDSMPWSFNLVKLPWMNKMIQVEW